jgi:hypothetical protein
MAEARLSSINCTQCGAPLTLHGGHRVESITCGYCGSVLDAHEDFKIIKTYTDLQRPYAPLTIGMSGRLKDVEFTIIGVVQYRDEWQDTWLEFAIFSPTHGYAWLEYNGGHFVFGRRVRDVPDTPIIRRAKSRFQASGYEFTVFSTYHATVVFVEGELTSVAEIGNTVELLDAIAPPAIYTVERTDEEEEYGLGEYLDAREVYAAFGLEDEPRESSQVHPAQPYRPGPIVGAASAAGIIFAPVAALLLLYTLIFGSGNAIVERDMRPTKIEDNIAVSRYEFSHSSPGDLLKLNVRVPRQSGWGSFDVRILQNNEVVYSLDKHLSTTGSSSTQRSYWTTPQAKVESYFKLPAAGKYTLQIAVKAAAAKLTTRGGVDVSIREGIKLSRYYLWLLVICFMAFALSPIARWRFEAKRWADEDDDDD